MKTFGELSRAEQVALFEAWLDGKPIQYSDDGKDWCEIDLPSWGGSMFYRIATIPDTVRWEMIDFEYKWYARDEDGYAFVYQKNPEAKLSEWINKSALKVDRPALLMKNVYTNNGMDWKDTLQGRPENV